MTGSDSRMDNVKSCQRSKNMPVFSMAVPIKYGVPEALHWPANKDAENGKAITDTTSKRVNMANNFLVWRNSFSVAMAQIILSKRPAEGSAGLH